MQILIAIYGVIINQSYVVWKITRTWSHASIRCLPNFHLGLKSASTSRSRSRFGSPDKDLYLGRSWAKGRYNLRNIIRKHYFTCRWRSAVI
jgi:hypothetical protein